MEACSRGDCNPAIVSRLVWESKQDINEDGRTAANMACLKGQCVWILAETGRVDWNAGNIREKREKTEEGNH